MTTTVTRALLTFAVCAFVCVLASVAHAADCDRGQRVATDVFRGADDEGQRRNCLNRRVRFTKKRLENGRVVRVPRVRTTKHVGCMVSNSIRDYGSAMQRLWDRMVDESWATIGPRQIRFNSAQSGTVLNPTRRTFVSAMPLDSDYATITLTKRGGRSTTQVAVCSHGPDGDTRLEYSEVIPGDRPDGYQWSPPELEDMINRLISVQIQPTRVGRQIGYVLQVDKGEVAELVDEEEAPQSSEPAESAPPAGDTDLPAFPGQGVQLPTGPVSLPGTATGGLPGTGDVSVPPVVGDPGQATANVGATSGQCLVTTTRRFPEIKLRCGLSSRDESVDVSLEFMADCPLIAGDTVNVEIDDEQTEVRITGRASGGEWCATSYSPGYYTGPCQSDRTDEARTQVRTYFYQGRRLVDTVNPTGCRPVRLEPGIYRVITEARTNREGSGLGIELREAGLRLEGEEMIGDVTGLLSAPITPR